MKPTLSKLHFPSYALAVLSIIFVSGCASSPDSDRLANRLAEIDTDNLLQVDVEVPPAWGPWLEDDLAEALYDRIRYIFKREGYPGDLLEVRRLEDPLPDYPTLAVRLYAWEVDRAGYVRCTMRVRYLPVGEDAINLGNFEAKEFTWGPRGAYLRAQQFVDAADAVALKVWKELRSEVPGFPEAAP
jgi:hypothetical protein